MSKQELPKRYSTQEMASIYGFDQKKIRELAVEWKALNPLAAYRMGDGPKSPWVFNLALVEELEATRGQELRAS